MGRPVSVSCIARGKGLDTHPELFVTLGLRGPSAPCPGGATVAKLGIQILDTNTDTGHGTL